MFTLKTVMDHLTDSALSDELTAVMTDAFEDFAETQTQFHAVMGELPEEPSSPSAREAMEAIRRQTASNLRFSGVLGIKANLEHFLEPASCFLDAEPEHYLRENAARRLPEYVQAQEVLDRFYGRLSPRQREDIAAYTSYLETVGPKLAHYYGYLVGNTLLSRVVPGYAPDLALTLRYCAELEAYFGKRFPWDLTEKLADPTDFNN